MAKLYPASCVVRASEQGKRFAAVIEAVAPGSPAERAGVKPGDRLLLLNGAPVPDVLDYRFRSSGEEATALIEKASGELVEVRKTADEDFGLEFEAEIFDRVRLCENNCPFCFVYQLPKGLRRSLYIKDDDYRLSFIHGNYVTLTNLTEADYRRIEEQRLSPLYVSVHATDPDVRAGLLGVEGNAEIMTPLRRLVQSRIQIHCQVVLCPGINDGDVLRKTLSDLASLYPGVQSVAVVPVAVGRHMPEKRRLQLEALSKNRGLAERQNFSHVTPEAAGAVLAEVSRLQKKFLSELGTRFAFAADEFYLLADAPIPGYRHYEGFPQLEDGIGIVRLFWERWRQVEKRLPSGLSRPRRVAFVTAELGIRTLKHVISRLNRVEGLSVEPVVVTNSIFGERINVAGLMIGRDVVEALRSCKSGGFDEAWVPEVAVREGRFLDNMTPEDVSRSSGIPVRVVNEWPRGIVKALRLLTCSGCVIQ
jgi:putative radical SAM enzyme (TIGR03279 family)